MLDIETQFESQLSNLQQTISALEQECRDLQSKASKQMSDNAVLLLEKEDCIRELKKRNGKGDRQQSPLMAIPTTLDNFDFKQKDPKPIISSTDQQQFCISSQNPLKSHVISATELKLYQSCQQMVDSASRMECSKCFGIFVTTQFYDHIFTRSGGESDFCCIAAPGQYVVKMTEECTLCFEDPPAVNDASLNPLKSSIHQSVNISKDFKSNGRLPPNPHNNRLRTQSRDAIQAVSVSFNRESEEASRNQITSLWH